MAISDNEWVDASDYEFNVEEGFLRKNFVFEVLQEGELIARPTEDDPWMEQPFEPTNKDRPLTAAEELNANWWDESETLIAARAPLNPEKRVPKKRKKPTDEISMSLEDSGLGEPPKKKNNIAKKK